MRLLPTPRCDLKHFLQQTLAISPVFIFQMGFSIFPKQWKLLALGLYFWLEWPGCASPSMTMLYLHMEKHSRGRLYSLTHSSRVVGTEF